LFTEYQLVENIIREKFGKQEYALVLGHEMHGVDQAVIDECESCVEIPQYGTKHSLNVAVSGGILIWHFFPVFRKRHPF